MEDPAIDRKSPASTGNDIVALAATDKDRTGLFRFYSRILSPHEQMLYHTPVLAGIPFESYVWLLWSIKESVYKYKKRLRPDLLFSPARIIVQQITPPSQNTPLPFDRGRWESAGQDSQDCSGDRFYQGVIHPDPAGILYSRSVIHDGMISSVVSDDRSFVSTWWGVRLVGDKSHAAQSSMVREFAVDRLKDVLPLDFFPQSVLPLDFPAQEALPQDSLLSRADLQTGQETGLHIGKSREGYPVVLIGDQVLDIPLSLAHHDRFVAYSFALPRLSPLSSFSTRSRP